MNDIEPVRTNWSVITGAPSSGKTSVISFLEKEGYSTVHDVARVILEEAVDKGVNWPTFFIQNLIVSRLRKICEELDTDKIIFFDYGFPDNLVFQNMNGMVVPEAVFDAKIVRYKNVFLLEPLVFESDGVRDKDKDKQLDIYYAIKETYMKYGYEPITVPVLSLEDRVEYIKSYIKEES